MNLKTFPPAVFTFSERNFFIKKKKEKQNKKNKLVGAVKKIYDCCVKYATKDCAGLELVENCSRFDDAVGLNNVLRLEWMTHFN